MDYVCIDSDDTVRSWLLTNPMLDDPQARMVYCYSDWGADRQAIMALRRVNYHNNDKVQNGAYDPAQP